MNRFPSSRLILLTFLDDDLPMDMLSVVKYGGEKDYGEFTTKTNPLRL